MQFRYETLPPPELPEPGPLPLCAPDEVEPAAGTRTGVLALASSAAGVAGCRGRSTGAGGAAMAPGVDSGAGTGGREPVEAVGADGVGVFGAGVVDAVAVGAAALAELGVDWAR